MKSNRKKTPKPPLNPDWLPAARKWGVATQFGFLRIIRKAFQCDEPRAIAIFEAAVESGQMIEVRKNGGVKFWQAK